MRTPFILLASIVSALPVSAFADAYDPPANYYSGATGTGGTLKSQLTTIMSTGHVQRTYGDYRFMSPLIEPDPNVPGNILLVYNRASVSGNWDNGITWNREHTWPDSRQPGNADNNATGAIGDPHMLRPSNPSINSSRGNKPYGLDNTTGAFGHVDSTYYFPGDADKGDVARAQFYGATRWSSMGLTLVDTIPTGFQMGDLSSLLHYHYADVPDEFERRRNHTISSQALNPSFFTNNRNAYIDRPEYAWSVFADQQNDTRLRFGTAASDGSSSVPVNLGRIIKGAPAPGTVPVTLSKDGVDGTYYEVSTSGNATSSVVGRYNAFVMDVAGSRTINAGLNVNTNVVGNYSGQIKVDNLDVTTDGGAGRGANDGNDVANLSLAVLEHSNASFDGGADLNSLTINFGTVQQGGTSAQSFSFFNIGDLPLLTAGLDLTGSTANGDAARFGVTGIDFDTLASGSSSLWQAALLTDQLGTFNSKITFQLADEALPGATGGQLVELNLTGTVIVPEPGAVGILVVVLGMVCKARPQRQRLHR